LPNFLTLWLLPVLLIFRFIQGSWTALGESILAIALIMLIFAFPFYKRALGAADIKFMMNLVVWLGLKDFFFGFLISSLITLPFLIFLASRHKERLWYMITNRGDPLENLESKDAPRIAYVPLVSLGIFLLKFLN
jgi:Flp pilus assembly protein protease CpaA